MGTINFRTTKEISVSPRISEQIIGQDIALNIIKKASNQRRNVLLIGEPGTGKSLLGQALAELLPKEKLVDTLSIDNPTDENLPLIRTVPRGQGKEIVTRAKLQSKSSSKGLNILFFIIVIFAALSPWWIRKQYGDIMAAASLISSMFILVVFVIFISMNKRMKLTGSQNAPKLLIDNSNKKKAPFIDGTGSHAGALLGDVLHDPLQCFFPQSIVYTVEKDKILPIPINHLVEQLITKYPQKIEKYEDYEGLFLPKEEEIYTLGYVGGKVKPVRILCVNKSAYNGKIYPIKTGLNKIILTPEHKVYVGGNYTKVKNLSGKENLFIHHEPILTKEDIIKTFSEKDQRSVYNYYKFLKIKQENLKFGYKKIAKILGIKDGQVRWWNNNKHKPIAFQTVKALEELDLLPLTLDNKKAPIIARILGTTFGDGGIFGNLNAIYLSSSELSSLKAYREDLISVFGNGIDKNFELRISGIKKIGKCLWNTNRKAVRFFLALGAPIGRKNKNLTIPSWVHLKEDTQKEFFGAILGNEICSPRFSPIKNKIQYFGIGLAGDYSLKENRLMLLREIAYYLNSYGIKSSPQINENEFEKNKYIWRLHISNEIENILRFYRFILIRYSNAKLIRLHEAIEKVLERKKLKYEEFIQLKKSKNYVCSILRTSKDFLQKLVLREDFEFDESKIDFSGTVYNITTESGNLFSNGILVSNSGGLGTPAYERLVPGMIHRANGGVLFIDEIGNLPLHSQQELLTAMQEKKYPITGQSERSSGAMVRSDPAPTDFILVAAGTLETIHHTHPALRSRIRGYGYEVYMGDVMEDTEENRNKLAVFIAQEVVKDNKIPHFTKAAVEEIINEARKRSGRAGKLTLRLRELGGLVRAAGDLASEEKSKFVEQDHVKRAKNLARTLEQQLADKYIEEKKKYEIIIVRGEAVGRVNGLAVIGSSGAFSGILLPIEAEVTPGGKKAEFVATGKLGEIAKEAVKNVSAIVLKYFGEDIKEKYDIFCQFLQTTPDGVEGDSASIAVATAIISALKEVPVRQDTAMTGSLSIRGEVLAIGGVTAKIEAALEAGIKRVIIPKTNEKDVLISKEVLKDLKIIPVSTIQEVLKEALIWKGKEKILKQIYKF